MANSDFSMNVKMDKSFENSFKTLSGSLTSLVKNINTGWEKKRFFPQLTIDKYDRIENPTKTLSGSYISTIKNISSTNAGIKEYIANTVKKHIDLFDKDIPFARGKNLQYGNLFSFDKYYTPIQNNKQIGNAIENSIKEVEKRNTANIGNIKDFNRLPTGTAELFNYAAKRGYGLNQLEGLYKTQNAISGLKFDAPFRSRVLSVAQSQKIKDSNTEKLIEEEKKIAKQEEDEDKERDKQTDKYQKAVVGSLGKITKWGLIAAPFAIARMVRSVSEGNFKNNLMFRFTGADDRRTFLAQSAFRRAGLDPAATNEIMGSLYGQYLSATYEGKFPRAVGWLLGKNPYHRDPTKTLDEIFKGYQKLDFDKRNMLLMDIFGGNAYKIKKAFEDRIKEGEKGYWKEDIIKLASMSPDELKRETLENMSESLSTLKDALSKTFTNAVIKMSPAIISISDILTKLFVGLPQAISDPASVSSINSLGEGVSSVWDKMKFFGGIVNPVSGIVNAYDTISDKLKPTTAKRDDIYLHLITPDHKEKIIPITEAQRIINHEVQLSY